MKEAKKALSEISQRKQANRRRLHLTKNRMMASIYGGIAEGKPIREIHKEILLIAKSDSGNGLEVPTKMVRVALSIARKGKRKASNRAFVMSQAKARHGLDEPDYGLALALFAYDWLTDSKRESDLSKAITEKIDKIEGNGKQGVIDDILRGNLGDAISSIKADGENVDLDSVFLFYLASEHKDSASDHAPYQGKLYVDENWRSANFPKPIEQAIEHFVSSHGINTFQWVIGKPVWFITRPNCRHYFKQISVREALSLSSSKLVAKYGMEKAIGDRQYLQTISHARNKEWYADVRNAQLLLQSYKDRLQMHSMMYKRAPTDDLAAAIRKDRLLIAKWTE